MLGDPLAFRQKLLLAFPPAPYRGGFQDCACDEHSALRQELPGKRWDEIRDAFIDFNSGSLPLMTQAAVVAFLPSWLLRSVSTFNGSLDCEVAEFTLYFLCPRKSGKGWNETEIAKLVALFDPAQRAVIADFLQLIVDEAGDPYWNPYARFGLDWWGRSNDGVVG